MLHILICVRDEQAHRRVLVLSQTLLILKRAASVSNPASKLKLKKVHKTLERTCVILTSAHTSVVAIALDPLQEELILSS